MSGRKEICKGRHRSRLPFASPVRDQRRHRHGTAGSSDDQSRCVRFVHRHWHSVPVSILSATNRRLIIVSSSSSADRLRGSAQGTWIATTRRGCTIAVLKKGARITGTERTKLAVELRKQYAKGRSIRELAETHGRSYGFVHRVLSESGVALRRRGGATRGKATKSKR